MVFSKTDLKLGLISGVIIIIIIIIIIIFLLFVHFTYYLDILRRNTNMAKA